MSFCKKQENLSLSPVARRDQYPSWSSPMLQTSVRHAVGIFVAGDEKLWDLTELQSSSAGDKRLQCCRGMYAHIENRIGFQEQGSHWRFSFGNGFIRWVWEFAYVWLTGTVEVGAVAKLGNSYELKPSPQEGAFGSTEYRE